MDPTRTLLSSIVKRTSPSTTDGVAFTTFTLTGEPHAAALVDAVADAWNPTTGRPRPRLDDLKAHAGLGRPLTLVRCAQSVFGSGSIVASEGRLFTVADGRIGLMPKGKRTKGVLVKPGEVLDILPGGTLDDAEEIGRTVRAQFPNVEPLTDDAWNLLPEPRDPEGPGPCPVAALVSWPMPDGIVPGCLYLFDERFREDKILGGWLIVPGRGGWAATSEHGSLYQGELSRMHAGRVVGWKGCTGAEALAWCDDYEAALRATVGQVPQAPAFGLAP